MALDEFRFLAAKCRCRTPEGFGADVESPVDITELVLERFLYIGPSDHSLTVLRSP
jgi:hypothetical protein